jgi:hypothetical protein
MAKNCSETKIVKHHIFHMVNNTAAMAVSPGGKLYE